MLQKHLEKLNKLVADNLIDINDFYCISFDRERVALQGEFNADLFRKYDELVGLEFDNETKWFKGSKNGIRMVLTIN